jgi:hypothetical protein
MASHDARQNHTRQELNKYNHGALVAGEHARPPATHKLEQGSDLENVLLLLVALQVAADPHAAAIGGRDEEVVLLARLFASAAGCLTEPVGLLQQALNLVPLFAGGRRPEAQTPMSVCLELQSWASDAKANTLVTAAPLAQPPVALYASQKQRGIRFIMATAAWQP